MRDAPGGRLVSPAARPGADCPVCQGRDPQCLVRLTAERRAKGRAPVVTMIRASTMPDSDNFLDIL